ncbi:MAG: aspartate--ammonia ligase [Nanoarchaeota archaeon]|nr:aspartate--ammonia ligase [Nanoarchaeota archaeon]
MKILPEYYKPKLGLFETEDAMWLVKQTFQKKLAGKLTLKKMSAPLFLKAGTGLQDDLAGTQVPVRFTTNFADGSIEMVHSLAKWKRHTLGKHDFNGMKGLYVDMHAIRRDEDIDETHSIYVDQWDWERIISKEQRSLEFLKHIVKKIYEAILDTEKTVERRYPEIKCRLPKQIKFIHTEDLEEMYPELSPKNREDVAAKEHGAIFLIGIGYKLRSGEPHDLRAADYDDWSTETSHKTRGLNGDIIVWDDVRKKSLELSSMGIRVDPPALIKQLDFLGLSERRRLEFHSAVLEERLPLTIGGGIGQSRLCMFLLQKAHIGEVQSSTWPEIVEREFEKREIALL